MPKKLPHLLHGNACRLSGFQEVLSYSMDPGRKSIGLALSSCLGPTILPCPGQAAEEVSPARGGTSAGKGLPPGDILRFREGGRARGIRGIWMGKFRPFLRKNHCLMMICEAPLRLDPYKTEEDRYIKLGGGKYENGVAKFSKSVPTSRINT